MALARVRLGSLASRSESEWVRKLIILVIIAVNSCGVGRSCTVNYWDDKAIWFRGMINCTGASAIAIARCKQVQLAYLGGKIDMSQNLNLPESENNWTLLMMASHQGNDELVKKLLHNGAHNGINMQDKCGWSALMFAAFNGFSLEVVRLLLEDNADVNLVNSDGRTALMMVGTNHQQAEIVKLLLENGANTRQLDKWGRSALTINVYVRYRCHPEVIKVFLQHGGNGRDLLHDALRTAVKYCCADIVADLIKAGDPVTFIDKVITYDRNMKVKCKNCDCLKVKAELMHYRRKFIAVV